MIIFKRGSTGEDRLGLTEGGAVTIALFSSTQRERDPNTQISVRGKQHNIEADILEFDSVIV